MHKFLDKNHDQVRQDVLDLFVRSRTRVSQPGLSPAPPQWPCPHFWWHLIQAPLALPQALPSPGKGKPLDLVLLLNSSLPQSPAMVPTLVPASWFRDNQFTTETKFWILNLCLKSNFWGMHRDKFGFLGRPAQSQVDQ